MKLKAEIRRSGNIWIQVEGVSRPLVPTAYRLTHADGKPLIIQEILPNEEHTALIIPAERIDIRR
ncbi:MAG: hypothetical protein AAFP00_08760, partial [Bacteroidota bacterium]